MIRLTSLYLSSCPTVTRCAHNNNVPKKIPNPEEAIIIICNTKYCDLKGSLFEQPQILPFHKVIEHAKRLLIHSVVYHYCLHSFPIFGNKIKTKEIPSHLFVPAPSPPSTLFANSKSPTPI
jgi:hypothetical protein